MWEAQGGVLCELRRKPRKGHLGGPCWLEGLSLSGFNLNPSEALGLAELSLRGWLTKGRRLGQVLPKERVYFQTGGSCWQTAKWEHMCLHKPPGN